MGKLRSVQLLRAIAVLAVVYAHSFATQRGTAGVDLFFVISGFIIARVSSDRSAAAFARARFWRIYPVYLLAALPYVAWMVLHGTVDGAKVAGTLTLWPIWGGQYQEPLLPVAWSLYFEILFYGAVTICLISRRLALAAAGGILLLAALWPSEVTAYLLSPISLEFAAGYCLARVRQFPLALPALVVGLALLFAPDRAFEGAAMLDPAQAGLRLLIFGIPAVMIVYGALGLEDAFAGRWATPLVLIGDASYSIYLTHLMPVRGLDVAPPAKVAVAILVGLAFYFTVERTLGRPPAPRRSARDDEFVPVPGAPALVREG